VHRQPGGGASPYGWLDYNFKNEAQERFFMDHHCARIFANARVAHCLAAMQCIVKPHRRPASSSEATTGAHSTAHHQKTLFCVCVVRNKLEHRLYIDDASNVKAIAGPFLGTKTVKKRFRNHINNF